MKRSDLYIRITAAVLFIAVAAYIGVYIYNAVINTYVTTDAMDYTIDEVLPAQGYIVRTETVISTVSSAILPTVSEGEKVASGQAVAVEYTSDTALETASEIRSIRLKIAKLEAPGADDEAARLGSVLALSAAVRSGDLRKLDELSLNIETQIFRGGASPEDELPNLKARLDTLEQKTEGMRIIYAPVSGVFSQSTDGFESVSPSALSGITPAALTELFSAGSRISGACKLVTEFTWYYAAIMGYDDASRLSVGRQITVQFSGTYNTAEQMLVESIGRREDGQCVVLFSSAKRVFDVTQLRGLSADILYNTVSGIRVPKEAIHLDDDGTLFVYLQTGVRAERVNVEILREYGDNYLVRDGAESGTPLRAGSTIIVKANDLFDGKIVAK